MTFVEPNLWEHQRTAVERAKSQPHFALYMEQGTGKTLTAITLMRELFKHYGRPLKTLILCPAIVVKNWRSEIERFSMCGLFVETLEGPTKKRVEAMERAEKAGKCIFITNLEMLAVGEGLLWEEIKGHKRVRDHKWELLIFDEAHRLKDGTAASTKMAIKIADKVFHKLLLTGTPILNSEADIWSQFRILDGGATFGQNFMAFRRQHFEDRNAGMPAQRHFPDWQLKPGSAEDIHTSIYAKAFRVTKDECLDLPPLVTKRIDVALSPKQRQHYEEMKRDFITYLESTACVAQLAVTKALRLQQIVTGFVKLEDESEVALDAAPRLEALSELLRDRPKGAKTIVWALFKQNYAAIAKVCEKLGRPFAFLTGLQSRSEKDQAEHDFTKGDVDVLIASPAAGGTGVNLVEADVAIYYSRGFSLGDRLQSIARNHRGGSERHKKVTLYDLCAAGTIDEHVLCALERKEDIAATILEWRDRV